MITWNATSFRYEQDGRGIVTPWTKAQLQEYLEPTHGALPLAGHAGHCAKVTTATITGRTDVPCSCETPDDDDWAKNIYQDSEGKFVMGKTKKSGKGKRRC